MGRTRDPTDDGILSPLATENKTTLAFSVLKPFGIKHWGFNCFCFKLFKGSNMKSKDRGLFYEEWSKLHREYIESEQWQELRRTMPGQVVRFPSRQMIFLDNDSVIP